MTTLMDLSQRTEEEKAKNRAICRTMYENAVATHNAAVIGLLPKYLKMPNHEGFIRIEGAAE